MVNIWRESALTAELSSLIISKLFAGNRHSFILFLSLFNMLTHSCQALESSYFGEKNWPVVFQWSGSLLECNVYFEL